MVNQKKIGRYEVVSVMGQGAMGTVYKAADPVIERVVAIKTINLDLSKEERAEFEERFYREAKSAGRLSHPNIVTIYDVGETEDAAYIAMEYIEGQSLRDVLDSGVVLPLKRICQIAVQIANALNYAHENGVVHRDIKPANIMISRGNEVKIMDFGIALIPSGSRTQAGTVLGSPKYMAPEQVAGKAADGRADIFSLGVVLYEMLTGSPPFNGDNLTAIMYKILNEEPPRPSKLNARVPPVFDRIVAKALAKRPEDRYQNAKEFSRELRSEAVLSALEPQQPAQKKLPGLASRRQDPQTELLDVKTEILLPAPRREHRPAPAPATKPVRYILLLAIPVAALAAYLVLKPAALPPAPLATDAQDAQVEAAAASQENPPSDTPPAPATQASVPASLPQPAKAQENAIAAAAMANATISLAIAPWGEVYVDGKKIGISPPLTRLEIEPGVHRIEIRNGSFAPHHVKVNLEPEQTLKIKHKFR